MYKFKLVVVVIAVSLLLNACGGVTPIPSPTISYPTKTAIPSTPIPSFTATITPESPVIELNKPSNIYDPRDPGLPELILPDGSGYRLDTNWSVAKIEYTFDWWGYSTEPVLGYEKIENKNSEYYWNDQKIDPNKISEFINSISNLHPTQSLLTGTWHTDDYPTWQVDITGLDGNHVLVYSSSNENPGYGPWHAIFNGRIYVEYGGEIGLAISKLFDLDEDTFVWHGGEFNDYHPANLMGFATTGWTNQMWYGFDGLLPLAGSFHYFINPETQELRGYVQGRYSIGGFGNLVVGTVTNLHSVTLSTENEQLSCDIEKIESEDAYSEEWTFNCKIPGIETGKRYRYPIKVVFDLNTGQKFIADGTIYGTIGSQNKIWIIPPSEEIQKAIDADPGAQALFNDVTIYVSRYNGKFQLGQDTTPVLSGEFLLVGEAVIDGAVIKYTVISPFIVEDQRFTRFGLTETELKRFLLDAVRSPITHRVRVYYPDATINLWYVSKDSVIEPQMPELWSGPFSATTKLELSDCADIPGLVYPTVNEPLRLFAFNTDVWWRPWSGGTGNIVQFMLIGDKTFVDKIDLGWWGIDESQKELDRFWQILLPSQLNILGMRPLQIRYSLQNKKLFAFPSWRANYDDIQAYKKSLSLLPVPFEDKISSYRVDNIGFEVLEDGSVMAITCVK